MVTLNNKTYKAVIGWNGSWSVKISAADVKALADGQSYVTTASLTDRSGATTNATAAANVDESASVSINPVNGNDFVTPSDRANGITLSGSASDSVLANIVGQLVTITLEGKSYSSTVQSDGTWSAYISRRSHRAWQWTIICCHRERDGHSGQRRIVERRNHDRAGRGDARFQ
jgi:hypothetical protein